MADAGGVPAGTDDAGGHAGGSLVHRGLLFAAVPFIGLWIRHSRESVFRWPHPAAWRLVTAVSVLYMMFVSVLLALPRGAAIAVVASLHPQITQAAASADRDYGTNCDLTAANVAGGLDVFVVAHVLGWLFKAVMIRDRLALWVSSVLFELLEETFKGILPNFRECWWDRWVLDVLVCNAAGIEFGMRLVNRFLEPFDWLSSRKSVTSPAYARPRWLILDSRRNLLCASLMLAVLQVADLNAFFLKTTLSVPVESPLNIYRVLIVAMSGLSATRELFTFMHSGEQPSKTTQLEILVATLALEIAVVLKSLPATFGPVQHLQVSVPAAVAWSSAAVLYIALLCSVPGSPEPAARAKLA